MSLIEGRRALRCIYGAEGGVFPGQTAYIADLSPRGDRVQILIPHFNGHIERIWTHANRLSKFHFETVPSEHPVHGHLPHGVDESHRIRFQRLTAPPKQGFGRRR